MVFSVLVSMFFTFVLVKGTTYRVWRAEAPPASGNNVALLLCCSSPISRMRSLQVSRSTCLVKPHPTATMNVHDTCDRNKYVKLSDIVWKIILMERESGQGCFTRCGERFLEGKGIG